MADPSEAVEFMRLVQTAETTNRQEGLEDLKFRFGEQWPAMIQNSRQLQDRPMLTINETDSYVRKAANQIREQRPRAKAHPVNDQATGKTAEVITGIIRHIDENSNAATAYDLASDFALTIGWGYWRLRTDYIREDSMYQDIYVDPVFNPFCVYFDPNSELPDGSDQNECLITDEIPKTVFRKQFPGASEQNFSERATGDSTVEWVSKENVRIAEYFKVERVPAMLVALSNGEAFYEDDLPPPEILTQAGIRVVGDRKSWKRKVRWQKQSAVEILQERTLPGRWIPVIPTYGQTVMIDGKRRRFGMVRFARDPQRMVNFWQTAVTETLAMAPKAKWLVAEGSDQGHENEFARANTDATAVLRYLHKDEQGGEYPSPQRIAPEPPPEGFVAASMMASQNLSRVIGMYDPAVRNTQRKSDKTINAEAQQTEITNFHFYDNLTRSMKHSARICIDWTPKIWDTKRVQRIIGDDGKPDLVTLNDRRVEDGIEKVLNDVTVGVYDVVMETGPGYASRRQESAAMLTQLLDTPLGEKIAQVADDIVIRNMDFYGADVVADRLAAANPLAQIDDKSDVPPKAQMMIKGLQQQLQQAQQMLQQAGLELKYKTGIEKMKQEGETRRTLMKTTAEMHKEELEDQTWRYDIDRKTETTAHDTVIKTETQKDIEVLKGHIALMLQKLENKAKKESEASEEATERAI